MNVQEQYWNNVACRQLLAHTNGTQTGCWSSISHAHNREDSLLSHTPVSGPTGSLSLRSLQVDTAAVSLQQRSAKEAARRKSSVAEAWKSVLPALRQN